MATPASVLVGQQYGRLVIVARDGNRATARCACGSMKTALAGNIASGKTKSCGCGRAPRKHGACPRGNSTPEYRSWRNMVTRCVNPNVPEFKWYGGRGITVCDRWRTDFAAFLADMGPRPPNTSIDRINNDGNYEPGNCRWATRAQQSANQRHAGPGRKAA